MFRLVVSLQRSRPSTCVVWDGANLGTWDCNSIILRLYLQESCHFYHREQAAYQYHIMLVFLKLFTASQTPVSVNLSRPEKGSNCGLAYASRYLTSFISSFSLHPTRILSYCVIPDAQVLKRPASRTSSGALSPFRTPLVFHVQPIPPDDYDPKHHGPTAAALAKHKASLCLTRARRVGRTRRRPCDELGTQFPSRLTANC